MQQAVICCDLEDLVLILALVATTYFCCDILLYFNMITLSRQSFLCRDNILFIPQICMSQHSFSATSTSWCRDQSFHVATVMLICFFKLMSRPRFSCHDSISVLVLVATLSFIIVISVATQKYDATKFCHHLACFLVEASFFMLRPRLLCWGCFTFRDPNILCHDNTFLHASYFPVAT